MCPPGAYSVDGVVFADLDFRFRHHKENGQKLQVFIRKMYCRIFKIKTAAKGGPGGKASMRIVQILKILKSDLFHWGLQVLDINLHSSCMLYRLFGSDVKLTVFYGDVPQQKKPCFTISRAQKRLQKLKFWCFSNEQKRIKVYTNNSNLGNAAKYTEWLWIFAYFTGTCFKTTLTTRHRTEYTTSKK